MQLISNLLIYIFKLSYIITQIKNRVAYHAHIWLQHEKSEPF